MRKITKKSLDELAKVMPVISDTECRWIIGGGGGTGRGAIFNRETIYANNI